MIVFRSQQVVSLVYTRWSSLSLLCVEFACLLWCGSDVVVLLPTGVTAVCGIPGVCGAGKEGRETGACGPCSQPGR